MSGFFAFILAPLNLLFRAIGNNPWAVTGGCAAAALVAWLVGSAPVAAGLVMVAATIVIWINEQATRKAG